MSHIIPEAQEALSRQFHYFEDCQQRGSMVESRAASIELLEQVVEDVGSPVWLDATVAEGILRDLLPGLPRERRALCLGVLVGFPGESLNAMNPTELHFAELRAIQRMSEEHLVSRDDAMWVVYAWNKALEGQREANPKQIESPYVPGRQLWQEATKDTNVPPAGHVFPPPPVKPPRSVPVLLITLLVTVLLFISLLAIRQFAISG